MTLDDQRLLSPEERAASLRIADDLYHVVSRLEALDLDNVGLEALAFLLEGIVKQVWYVAHGQLGAAMPRYMTPAEAEEQRRLLKALRNGGV